jgi:hypothetical protein
VTYLLLVWIGHYQRKNRRSHFLLATGDGAFELEIATINHNKILLMIFKKKHKKNSTNLLLLDVMMCEESVT